MACEGKTICERGDTNSLDPTETACTQCEYLADEAVVFPADGTVEHVDRVLVHAPARAVSGGAVIAALAPRLRHRQTPLQPALVLLCGNQLIADKRTATHSGMNGSCLQTLCLFRLCENIDSVCQWNSQL